MLMKAKVLEAQATPRLSYIALAKSLQPLLALALTKVMKHSWKLSTYGNPAPKLLRIKSLPASTLAAYSGYASGR